MVKHVNPWTNSISETGLRLHSGNIWARDHGSQSRMSMAPESRPTTLLLA